MKKSMVICLSIFVMFLAGCSKNQEKKSEPLVKLTSSSNEITVGERITFTASETGIMSINGGGGGTGSLRGIDTSRPTLVFEGHTSGDLTLTFKFWLGNSNVGTPDETYNFNLVIH